MAKPPPPERPPRADRGADARPAEGSSTRSVKRVSSNPANGSTRSAASTAAGERPAARGNGTPPARPGPTPRPPGGGNSGARAADAAPGPRHPRPDPGPRRPDDARRPAGGQTGDPARPADSRPGTAPRGARPIRNDRPARARDVPAPVGPPPVESSWTSFFLPNTSSKPGTMPAGMVLVVVVAALVVAMFLSADSINRKAASRRTNAEWRKTTSEMVANVSKTLKLDAPEKALDNAVAPYIGHERKTSDKSTADLLAERRAAEAAAGATAAAPSTLPGGAAAPSTVPPPTEPGAPATTPSPPTTVDPRPKLRTPTPASPLKVWFGGDSISYEPGTAFSNIAAESKLFTVTVDSKASSGLSRPDFFNWPEHLDRDVVPLAGGGAQPDILVIMFGGNDGQNIPMPPPVGGFVFGSADWQTEYRKRVGDTMDLLRSPKNDRLVIWAGMPIVGPRTVNGVDQMDYIYYTEAKKRPWVVYFDSWAFFMTPEGAYAKSLPAADGEQHVMRANDNVHLSLLGGDRLAWALHNRLGKIIDLSAAPVTGEPKQLAPPEVVERPEVPPGENQAPAG